MNWLKLENSSDFQHLLNASFSKDYLAVAIFKHSTRCAISLMVKSRLMLSWDFKHNELPIYYLDLIQYRSISNQIADELSVAHESPQLLVIKNGKCIYHASHNGISIKELQLALKDKI